MDDIRVTGVITTQITPVVDNRTPLPGTCPGTCNPGVGDHGTAASLVVREDNGDAVIERGEKVTLDASGSSLPGGCVGGVAQFRFLRDNVVVQDWSTNNQFIDSPQTDANYALFVRCSADFNCTGTTGVASLSRVYSGDGSDLSLTLTHLPGGTASIAWQARPQPSSVTGYDLFRGTITGFPGDPNLATLTCFTANLAQQAIGTNVSAQDATPPPIGQAFYYLAGHSSNATGGKDALGRKSDTTIRVATVNCP